MRIASTRTNRRVVDGMAAGSTSGRLGRLERRTVPVLGRPIFYRVGIEPLPATAPVVVVIHGLSISSRYEVPFASRLATSCRVYAPDLPGFGRSADPPTILDVGGHAEALAAWCAELGLGPVSFVGNSLGAHVVVELAALYPRLVDRLVLSGLTVDPWGRSMATQFRRTMIDVPREPVSLLALHLRDFMLSGPGRVLKTLRLVLRHDFAGRLAAIKAPTLIVRGERDPMASREWSIEVANRLARGRYAEVPGAAHAVNYNSPDAFAALVHGFVGAAPTDGTGEAAATDGAALGSAVEDAHPPLGVADTPGPRPRP